MERSEKKIKVIFRERSGEVVQKEFTMEDRARDFCQEHLESCVVVDKRCEHGG